MAKASVKKNTAKAAPEAAAKQTAMEGAIQAAVQTAVQDALVKILRDPEKTQEAGANHSLLLDTNYMIRTVTHYCLGRLTRITDTDLVMEEASWIADTGRWHDCLKNGECQEVEPFVHDAIISRAAIVDITQWDHDLLTEQK